MNKIDDFLRNLGYYTIGGVDEAGRGSLAGPVVAACVVLDYDNIPLGIKDSKKLTNRQRRGLSVDIKNSAVGYGWGIVHSFTIDDINILESTKMAMKMAIICAQEDLAKYDRILDYVMVDAVRLDWLFLNVRTISFVYGEDKSLAVAAASILAKVIRDDHMIDMNHHFPGYDFDKNKGYPTREHIKGLLKHGPCEIHRRSYRPVKEACDNGSQLVSKTSGP